MPISWSLQNVDIAMASTTRPPRLQQGATIAFISLSLRLNTVFPLAISRARDALHDRGYKTKEIFQGVDAERSIEQRLLEFKQAFCDREISAIVCTIGGSSFTELLPALVHDTELHAAIRTQPKIVVGLSDMTGLHWFLNACVRLRTFYGPSVIPELGTADDVNDASTPRAFCFQHMLDVATKPTPLGDVPRSANFAAEMPHFFQNPVSIEKQKVSSSPPWIWVRKGEARGRLFGGCLSVMARLGGVKAIAPDWKGRIVFVESSASDADDVDNVRQNFADLLAHGVFDEAVGLVVGRPYAYTTPDKQDQYIAVIKRLLCQGPLADRNPFPILFNVDIGHTTPMVTLPYDAMAELDSEGDRFAVVEAGVL